MNRLIIITGVVVAVCVYLMIMLPRQQAHERRRRTEIHALVYVETATRNHLLSGGSLPSDWQAVFQTFTEEFDLTSYSSNQIANILTSNYEVMSKHVSVLGPHGPSQLFVLRRKPDRRPAGGLGRWAITVSGTNVVRRWLPESELQTYLNSGK